MLLAGQAWGWSSARTAGVLVVALAALLALRVHWLAPTAAAALAGVLAALLHATALWHGPVADLVSARAVVVVTGVAQAAPRARAGPAWSTASHGWFPLASGQITGAPGTTIDVGIPIEVTCVCLPGSLPAGAVVRVEGRLAPARTAASAAALRADRIAVLRGPGPIDAVAGTVRDGLARAVQGLPPERAGLVTGLAVGDTAVLPPELEDGMRAVGLSHLTAVSGGNVAIVVGAVFGVAALLRARLRVRVVLSLAAVAAFAVLVGPQPSVVRASAMAAVAILALLSGGRRAGPSVLAASVLVLVIVSPALAVSWGFALSAGATAGLVWLAPRLRARLPARFPAAPAEALTLTVAAQLATLPVLIAMGAGVSWASIPANLLAMPAVPPVTVLGLLAAVTSPLAPAAAAGLAWVASWPAGWIAGVAWWAQGLPAADLVWPSGIAGFALLAAAIAALLIARRLRARVPRGTARALSVVLVVVLVLMLLDPPGRRAWPPPDWRVVACDVGQGDALVLRGADTGSAVLVDAGPDARLLGRCLADLDVERLDAIVLTHFHADHVDGLPAALRLPVGAVFVTATREPAEGAARTLALAQESQIPVRALSAGQQLRVPGIALEVLWPARKVAGGSAANNASIVLAGEIAGLRVLLTGDVEREAQEQIARLPRVGAQVVKLPHHGSANLDPGFVAWARAPLGIVSVGEGNDYGHPAPRALEAWAPALLGRTDTDGALAVVLRDGRPALVRRG